MKKKRILALLLTMILMVGSLSTSVFAAPTQAEVDSQIRETAEYLAKEYDGDISADKYFYVFLIASSGIECSSIINQFKDSIVQNITANGKLMDHGTEKPEIYGSIIMTLKACGIDPTNIGGRNLLTDMANFLSTYNFNLFDGNFYELGYLMTVLEYYKNDMPVLNSYVEPVKDAILNFYCAEQYEGTVWVENPVGSGNWIQQPSIVPGTGFYHYGFSSDNDAKIISILNNYFSTDSEVKPIIDQLIPKMKSTIDANNQVDGYGYGANSDSTGLVLSVLSVIDDSKATDLYAGLLGFKSQTTKGAYFYGNGITNPDPEFATRDALEGLISYQRMLLGKPSLYDLSAYDTILVTNYSNLNVSVQNSNTLPIGSRLNIAMINNIPASVTASLSKVSKSFLAFDISLLLNGANIQPTSPLQLVLDIPTGYANPAIYYVNENGTYEKINSSVVNGKITFTLTHFSTYAVVDEVIAPATSDSNQFIIYATLAIAALSVLICLRRKIACN